MKARLYKILAAVFGVFGLLGCVHTVAYGTPYGDYQVRGKVTDESGEPVEGIEVRSLDRHSDTTTDTNGEYIISANRPVSVIEFIDIDGPDKKGSFERSYLRISDKDYRQIAKGDGWYTGKFLADHQDKELSKEE